MEKRIIVATILLLSLSIEVVHSRPASLLRATDAKLSASCRKAVDQFEQKLGKYPSGSILLEASKDVQRGIEEHKADYQQEFGGKFSEFKEAAEDTNTPKSHKLSHLFAKVKAITRAVGVLKKKDKVDPFDVTEVSKECKESDLAGFSEMYRPLFEALMGHKEEERTIHGFKVSDIEARKGQDNHIGHLYSYLSSKDRVEKNKKRGSSLKHEIKEYF